MLVKTRTNREAYHDCIECRHKLGGTLHVVGSRKRCDPVDAIHKNIYILLYIDSNIDFVTGMSVLDLLRSS